MNYVSHAKHRGFSLVCMGFLVRVALMIVFVVSIEVYELYVVVPTWLRPNGARFIPSKTKLSQLVLTSMQLVALDLPRGSECSYFWEDSKFYPFQLERIIDANGTGLFQPSQVSHASRLDGNASGHPRLALMVVGIEDSTFYGFGSNPKDPN